MRLKLVLVIVFDKVWVQKVVLSTLLVEDIDAETGCETDASNEDPFEDVGLT